MVDTLRVSTRLFILNAIVALLAITLVAVGYSMISRIGASLADVRGMEGNRVLAAGSDAIWELRFGIANYTLASPENRKKILAGRQMVPAIQKTSSLVQGIAAASQEQSANVGQINMTMGQLNQITQRNASASEELAATSEEMGAQVQTLQRLIGFFQVAAGERPLHHAPATQPRQMTAAGSRLALEAASS